MTEKTYTSAEVYTVLSVFDDLISLIEGFDGAEKHEYWQRIHDESGTPGLRTAAVEMGPKIEAVWVEMGGYDAFEPPFDYEVVPEFIRLAVLRHGDHTLTHEQWVEIGHEAQINLRRQNESRK